MWVGGRVGWAGWPRVAACPRLELAVCVCGWGRPPRHTPPLPSPPPARASATRTPTPRPDGASPVRVTARIEEQQNPVASAQLHYLSGVNGSEVTVPMTGGWVGEGGWVGG